MKHQARKRFGQHFLTDHGIIDSIVRAVGPRPGQALVEIGPGLGALTQPLVERCGQLTVVELDRDLAARLRQRADLKVVESDVLLVDFAALADELQATRLRVVGNLPYNIFDWVYCDEFENIKHCIVNSCLHTSCLYFSHN